MCVSPHPFTFWLKNIIMLETIMMQIIFKLYMVDTRMSELRT
jgi:hypothetical protein